jgi:HSP20 family protein
MKTILTTEWSWPRRGLSPDIVGEVFGDFDRIVDSFLRPTFAHTVGFQPSCDVTETKDHYLVAFDMPGVKKEDVKIEVEGSQLVVSGERQRGMRFDDGEASLRHERSHGKFERTFALPTSINTDKIEAHYEDGVLNVAIPKAESAKARSVQIQSGQASFLNKLLGSKKEDAKEMKEVKIS